MTFPVAVTSESSQFENLRLALVGASSLLGVEIKDQLAASGVPRDAVTLFDLKEVAGVLTEYGDEARVFAETVSENLLTHSLICFCSDGKTATESLDAILASGKVGIDCTQAWSDDPRAFAWIPGVSAPPARNDQRAIVIPSAACLMLGTTLAALGKLGEQVSVTIFLPASDLGEAGLQELSQQSIAVLNLEEVDTAIFGRQLAFDLWPTAGLRDETQKVLVNELGKLGFVAPPIQIVRAPVFHGLAMSLYVPDVDASEVSTALFDANVVVGNEDGVQIDSPLLVTGTPGLHAISVRPDHHGAWVWLTIDNFHARAAAAVEAMWAMSTPEFSDGLQ